MIGEKDHPRTTRVSCVTETAPIRSLAPRRRIHRNTSPPLYTTAALPLRGQPAQPQARCCLQMATHACYNNTRAHTTQIDGGTSRAHAAGNGPYRRRPRRPLLAQAVCISKRQSLRMYVPRTLCKSQISDPTYQGGKPASTHRKHPSPVTSPTRSRS